MKVYSNYGNIQPCFWFNRYRELPSDEQINEAHDQVGDYFMVIWGEGD